MFKIDIDFDIENLINKLNTDGNDIVEIMNDINKNVFEIDETKWNSPERKKIDDELIPYLAKKEKKTYEELGKCNLMLQRVKNAYEQLDGNLNKVVERINGNNEVR